MDFIEALFGIAPDGGDGSLEVVWMLAVAALLLAVAFRGRIRAWFSPRSASSND